MTTNPSLTLRRLPGRFAVCRLAAEAPVPEWAAGGSFFSVTRAPGELSVVCPEAQVPPGVEAETGWACLGVEGPLELSLVGVLAGLTAPLAAAGVSLFALSTFRTDYLLVKEAALAAAVAALREAGHRVEEGA